MGLFGGIIGGLLGGGGSSTTVTQQSTTSVNNTIDIKIGLEALAEVFNQFNSDVKGILTAFTSGQGDQTAAQKEANALMKIEVLTNLLGKEQELQLKTEQNKMFKAALLMGGSVLAYYGWKKWK